MLPIPDIRRLFIKTINFGREVRKSGKNGQELWQPIKKKYGSNPTGVAIKTTFQELSKQHYFVPSTDTDHSTSVVRIDGGTLRNTDLPDHFLVQLFRIPCMEQYDVPIYKLLQMAFNIGQFLESEYDPSVVSFFNDNQLGQFDTYVNRF